MAEETLKLVPAGSLRQAKVPYLVDFSGQQRQAEGIRYRLGRQTLSGPVAYKVAMAGDGVRQRLERELEVVTYLDMLGGELLSKCVAYDFDKPSASALVTYRGSALADLTRDGSTWPPGHDVRRKIVLDLLKGIELLRVSRVVHGGIGLDTLRWDGTALQITEFGQAGLAGRYPDGRAAHHSDDIRAAGRVIYQVHTGDPPPADQWDLRRQLEQVHDAELRDLLLQRDLVAGTDRYYVFDEDPERRPTSRVLLDRTDLRPRGVQWERVVAADRAARADFRQLRERQRSFRTTYRPPAPRRPARQPLFTARPGQPGASGQGEQSGQPPVSGSAAWPGFELSAAPGQSVQAPRPRHHNRAKYARPLYLMPILLLGLCLVLVLIGVL